MRPPEVALTGAGLVSAVGEDAVSAAASIEAGLAGMSTLRLPDRGGNALVGCPAIEVDVPHGHVRRLWDFARRAALQALAQAGVPADQRERLHGHVLWTLPAPDRPGYGIEPEGPWHAEFFRSLGFRTVSSEVVAAGPAGAAQAALSVLRTLQTHPHTVCLLGGADTLIQLRVLRWLQRADRLRTEIFPDGLIPGEAGAFVCLESWAGVLERNGAPLCLLEAAAYAAAEPADGPDAQARAASLSRVIRGVLPAAPAIPSIERLYVDLNGESLRALEWGLASVRVLEQAGVLGQLVHPADCVGDVGAVSCAMHLGLAALHLCSSAPGARSLVVAASETGERGALMLVRPVDGAPAPGVRRQAATATYRALLAQSFDEAGFLWSLRSHRLAAPDGTLREYGLLDARLRAHLRALRLADDPVPPSSDLDAAPEEVFARLSCALWAPDVDVVAAHALVAEAAHSPASWQAAAEALGFASPRALVGLVQAMLADASPAVRGVALRACMAHGADPGPALAVAMGSDDWRLRGTALRAAGELAATGLASICVAALGDPEPVCRYWAARSAVLLGERHQAPRTLLELTERSDPIGAQALHLLLCLQPPDAAAALMHAMRGAAGDARRWIEAAGWAGDPVFLPRLIDAMQEPRLARAAGAAFSMITGVPLDGAGLAAPAPAGGGTGPDDDPAHEDVAPDPDDGLDWPDAGKVVAWWARNASRLQPGRRYFMGDLPTPVRCLDVLETGFQRQRVAAAQHLSLLRPHIPLFNTAAPAWRQRRQLERARAS